ncbi:MAG: hypothetical protein DMF06_08725 [Verrucomicrobia bacterium]|nr:MAG: hypothetical protein DMF06_08725 [Verrucomicrobiota bacterium]
MRNFLSALLCALCVSAFCFQAEASTVVSATITITNSAALTNATSGQKYTLNGDARTFTNSVASASTQVRVLTNYTASQILLSLVVQAGSYPFTGIQSMTASAGTNVTFRATNDTALTITLSPTNYGKVTYSTQTVGVVQTIIRVPMSAEDSVPQTNNPTRLWQDLDAYSQTRRLGRLELSGRLELQAGFGLHGRYLVSTNYTLTTNDLYIGVDTRSNTNLILTLPSAASASNLLFVLKDEGGSAGTNTLKIYPASGDRIDTLLTNLVVSNNFGGVQLRSRGGTNWNILASGGGVTGGIASSGGGGVELTNSVWVAKNGNNSTGARGDASKPFLTLGAAKTNAISGDTIFVMPGTYDEKNLLKNGVNWHGFGASVIFTGGSGAIWDDNADSIDATSIIEGFDILENQSGDAVLQIFNNSTVTIRARTINSPFGYAVMVGGGGTNTICTIEDSTVAVSDSSGLAAVQVRAAAAHVTLNRCKLTSAETSNAGSALRFEFAANTNSVLRDCVLIGNLSAGSPVSISGSTTGTKIRIYGSLMSNLTNDVTNTSFLTGATRFEVSADVR